MIMGALPSLSGVKSFLSIGILPTTGAVRGTGMSAEKPIEDARAARAATRRKRDFIWLRRGIRISRTRSTNTRLQAALEALDAEQTRDALVRVDPLDRLAEEAG